MTYLQLTHGGLNTFDVKLLLQRDGKAVKWSDNLAGRLQVLIKLLRAL